MKKGRTIRTKVFKFNELSETAKEKAISILSDINVSYDWWEYTYEDAKNIGLQIDGFDLDRNRHATGSLIESLPLVCHSIIDNHGKDCETYKTAKEYLTLWDSLVEKYSDGEDLERVSEENINEFDNESDEIENEFRKSLLEDYSIMLQEKSEYLQSKEAIIETIEANEYEFYQDGTLYNGK